MEKIETIQDIALALEVGVIINDNAIMINSIQNIDDHFVVRTEEFKLSGNSATKLFIGIKINQEVKDCATFDEIEIEEYKEYVKTKKKPRPIMTFTDKSEYISDIRVSNALLSDIGRRFEDIDQDEWISSMKGDEQVVEFKVNLVKLKDYLAITHKKN